jgi:hypothetical protein
MTTASEYCKNTTNIHHVLLETRYSHGPPHSYTDVDMFILRSALSLPHPHRPPAFACVLGVKLDWVFRVLCYRRYPDNFVKYDFNEPDLLPDEALARSARVTRSQEYPFRSIIWSGCDHILDIPEGDKLVPSRQSQGFGLIWKRRAGAVLAGPVIDAPGPD